MRVRVLSNRHVVPEILVEILSFSVMLRCNLYYEYVFFKYTRLFSISFILRPSLGGICIIQTLNERESSPFHFFLIRHFQSAPSRGDARPVGKKRRARKSVRAHVHARARLYTRGIESRPPCNARYKHIDFVLDLLEGKRNLLTFGGTFLNFEATKDGTREDEQREGDERNEGR